MSIFFFLLLQILWLNISPIWSGQLMFLKVLMFNGKLNFWFWDTKGNLQNILFFILFFFGMRGGLWGVKKVRYLPLKKKKKALDSKFVWNGCHCCIYSEMAVELWKCYCWPPDQFLLMDVNLLNGHLDIQNMNLSDFFFCCHKRLYI